MSPIVATVAIVPNARKEHALLTTQQLADWLIDRGVTVRVSSDVAAQVERPDLAVPESELFAACDLVIVLGGDGTLLGVAKQACVTSVPLLGVNLGHLGFLTEVELPELYEALPAILADCGRTETRMMIEAEVHRQDGSLVCFLALNEAVVTTGPCNRLIEVDTYVGGDLAATYPADGLIVATPTGSTAYALSAGGPIVSPGVDTITIVPVCPHMLAARALVVSRDEVVRLAFRADHDDIWLTVDGQPGCALSRQDEVVIRRAAAVTRLVRRADWSFYDVLRRKLTGDGSRER